MSESFGLDLHLTQAAEALQITQLAVSAAIDSLETEYDVKLFHQINRRIELAEAGRLLKVDAEKILNAVASTEQTLRELGDLQSRS